LRYGCLCNDENVYWTLPAIAKALDISRTAVVNILSRWRDNGFEIPDDERSNNGKIRILSPKSVDDITSPAELNRQAAMTLTERVLDIKRRYGLKLCRASLYHYYRRRNIKYRTVNLHMTAKF
jgi:transposase